MKSISIINGNCEISNDDPPLFSLDKCLEDDVHVKGILKSVLPIKRDYFSHALIFLLIA